MQNLIDIRDGNGHLLFRLDPTRCEVHIKQKNRPVQRIDLSAHVQPKAAASSPARPNAFTRLAEASTITIAEDKS